MGLISVLMRNIESFKLFHLFFLILFLWDAQEKPLIEQLEQWNYPLELLEVLKNARNVAL